MFLWSLTFTWTRILTCTQTSRDIFDASEFSFPHLLQFVRLGMAYIVELADWVPQS